MTTQPHLILTEFTARNFLGLRQLSISPGAVTVLAGKNGVGKSSAIDGMFALLRGGTLADRQTTDTDESAKLTAVLKSADGSKIYRLTKTGADTVEVQESVEGTDSFRPMRAGATFLSSLFDETAANPIKLVGAKDDVFVKALLSVLDVHLDRARYNEIISEFRLFVPPMPQGIHPLTEIDFAHEAIYARRTGVNVTVKAKRDGARVLRAKNEGEIPPDYSDEIANHQAEVARVIAEANERKAKIEADRVAASALARSEYDTALAKAKAAYERAVAAAKEARDAKIQAADEAARAAHDSDPNAEGGYLETARALIADLQERQAARQLMVFRADQANTQDAEAATDDLVAKRMTATLDALKDLARTLTENLPIHGLKITAKATTVHGVPLSQLNMAQRLMLAVRIAAIRARQFPLPIIFLDGAAELDSDNFALLVDYVTSEPGVLLVTGRTTDDDGLNVYTADRKEGV